MRLTEIFLFFFSKKIEPFNCNCLLQKSRQLYSQTRYSINWIGLSDSRSKSKSTAVQLVPIQVPIHIVLYTIIMSNIEKLLMNGGVGIVFKLVGVACEDSVVGRWLTSPSSPLLAIAAMTVVVGVSVVIVVLDVESHTHLCAITFFGFACGALKGLEVGYSQGIPTFQLVVTLPA